MHNTYNYLYARQINRNYILFDDLHRDHLLPFTFIRPVAEMRIGILTIREKWERWTGREYSWLTQDYLREKYPVHAEEENILINGAITPNRSLVDEITALKAGEVLMSNNIFVAGCLDKTAVDSFEGLPPVGLRVKGKSIPLITTLPNLASLPA